MGLEAAGGVGHEAPDAAVGDQRALDADEAPGELGGRRDGVAPHAEK